MWRIETVSKGKVHEGAALRQRNQMTRLVTIICQEVRYRFMQKDKWVATVASCSFKGFVLILRYNFPVNTGDKSRWGIALHVL